MHVHEDVLMKVVKVVVVVMVGVVGIPRHVKKRLGRKAWGNGGGSQKLNVSAERASPASPGRNIHTVLLHDGGEDYSMTEIMRSDIYFFALLSFLFSHGVLKVVCKL